MSAGSGPAAAAGGLSSVWLSLRRDRGTLVTGGLLVIVAALAWVTVVAQSAHMAMPAGPATVPDALLFAIMWGVMMAAMMLPSALPMIGLYGLVRRGQRAIPTWAFAATYLVVWLLLGVPVYAASVGVAAVAGSEMAVWLPYALAAVLVGAGAYQFSAIKRVCLKNCQGPLGFVMERWHASYRATLRLGLAHAAYCVGCCWGLMVILVAAGAMSLPWVLLIAAVVFAEKLLPRGEWTARAAGAALVLLGVAVAVQPDLAVALRGAQVSDEMSVPGRAPMAPMKMGM